MLYSCLRSRQIRQTKLTCLHLFALSFVRGRGEIGSLVTIAWGAASQGFWSHRTPRGPQRKRRGSTSRNDRGGGRPGRGSFHLPRALRNVFASLVQETNHCGLKQMEVSCGSPGAEVGRHRNGKEQEEAARVSSKTEDCGEVLKFTSGTHFTRQSFLVCNQVKWVTAM